MAKSKNGGAFQFIQGSIGSVTFSTSSHNTAGRRQQIARQKVTSVRNPNTIPQILQRMKVAPAQRFYNAINGVDDTLLLEHSWENKKYGPTGRLEFMSRALKADGPYIPKNATRFIPAEYEVASGTLQPARVERDAEGIVVYATLDTAATVNAKNVLTAIAGDANAQVTIVKVTQKSDGTFVPEISRWIPAYMADEDPANFPLDAPSGGSEFYHTSAAALAVIVSKRDASGNWLRSNAKMVLSPVMYASLYSLDAQDEAIASYETGGGNALGSSWYLNLANGQKYPGQLSAQDAPASLKQALGNAQVLVGRRVSGDGLITNVFVVGDDIEDPLVVVLNNELTVIEGITADDLDAATDPWPFVYVPYNSSYALQIGLSQSQALITAMAASGGGGGDDDDPRP